MNIATFGYAIYNTTTGMYLQEEDAKSWGDISGAGILTTEDDVITASIYLFSDELLVGVVREQQNTKRIDCAPIASISIFNQQSS